MVDSVIVPGRKIELTELIRSEEGSKNKIYYSAVYDILSEDKIQILMPMEKSKLVLLQVDTEYEMVVYDDHGLYQCLVQVIDRYKADNIYVVVVELISNLRKFQRREFYRYSCVIGMKDRLVKEEEKNIKENKEYYIIDKGLPLKNSVIVDISGGGIRFITNEKFETGALLYCTYTILVNEVPKTIELIGKLLRVDEVDNKPGSYIHRLQFIDIKMEERELIIKYIFQEERKGRKLMTATHMEEK